MKRLHLALLIGTSFLGIVSNSWGQAVSVDAGSLIRRLDAIESRLDKTESRRSSGGAATSIGGANAYSVNDLEQRMGDLEDDTNQLRGNSERSLQAIGRLAKRFDDYVKDMDMRMGDIEARMEAMGEAQKKSGTATPASANDTSAAEPEEEAKPVTGTPVSAATPTTPSVKPVAGIPASMSASDHYNKAYAYLTATDYKNAQVWFEEFLKRHPKDALADNAYYWLGEVYLVQNNPTQAVGKFRDGIKAFPKGSKVTANLFKMGVALEQLKQPKLARAAWEKLVKEYPNAPETARAKDKLINLKG